MCKGKKGAKTSKGGNSKSGKDSKSSKDSKSGASGSDPWQSLRGTVVLTPTAVESLDLIISGSKDAAGLPDAKVLSDMINASGKLSYKGATTGKYGENLKGISFHIAEFTTQGGTVSSKTSLYNDFLSKKANSAVCFENVILPVARKGKGNLLVHQSLAPCTNCCNGFKAWAKQEKCTIVVSYDKGYDSSGGDGWYIFASDGNAYGYRPNSK